MIVLYISASVFLFAWAVGMIILFIDYSKEKK